MIMDTGIGPIIGRSCMNIQQGGAAVIDRQIHYGFTVSSRFVYKFWSR